MGFYSSTLVLGGGFGIKSLEVKSYNRSYTTHFGGALAPFGGGFLARAMYAGVSPVGHAWGALRAGGVSLRGFLLGYGFPGLSGSDAWQGVGSSSMWALDVRT